MGLMQMTIGDALRLAKCRLLERVERKKPQPAPVRSTLSYEPPLSQAMRAQIEAQRNAYGQRSLTQLAMLQQQAALNQQAAYAQLQAMQNRRLGQAPVSYGASHYSEMTQVATTAFPFLHSAAFHANHSQWWMR